MEFHAFIIDDMRINCASHNLKYPLNLESFDQYKYIQSIKNNILGYFLNYVRCMNKKRLTLFYIENAAISVG